MEDLKPAQTIQIVAGVIRDAQGRFLLVRKAGSGVFMQAGGKPQGDEAPLDTLDREIREELGCSIDRETAEFDGAFEAPAALEAGYIVITNLYRVQLIGEPRPSAEIEELAWVSPGNPDRLPLAPLTKEHVFRRYEKHARRESPTLRLQIGS